MDYSLRVTSFNDSSHLSAYQMSTGNSAEPLVTSSVYVRPTTGNGSIGDFMCGSPLAKIKLMQDIGVYIVSFFCCIAYTVGLLGNAVMMFIILRNKVMHHAPNVFIFSIALGDFVYILVFTPFSIFIYALNEWSFGVALCKFSWFLQTLSMGVSIFTLTCMSWDRYTAIAKPMEKQRNASLHKTFIHVAVIWIAAMSLAVLDVVAATVDSVISQCGAMYFCNVTPLSWGRNYEIFRATLHLFIYFLIPLLSMAYFYISMARVLLSSTNVVERGDRFHRQLDVRIRTIKIALSLVVLFMLCWLPKYIYEFLWYIVYVSFNDYMFALKLISYCLAFMNSCVNPIALYLLSRQYRHFYNNYLFCCCKYDEQKVARRANNSTYSTIQTTALISINSDKAAFTL